MKKVQFLFAIVSFFLILGISSLSAHAKNITVVIDPGHGGENLGGTYGNFIEKEMTLKTAYAMKDHLEQYDDVIVYLTHDNPTDDMSLKKRAQFAASVDADFLFSLHYNMSEEHRFYGTEVWTSAFDNYYQAGTQFGLIETEELSKLGLFNRGIKTRLNDRGTDYYGIIREAREVGVPCVIIEHCHIDEPRDAVYLENADIYKTFGEINAESVAKFFRLSSKSLDKDYSSYQVPVVEMPTGVVKPDLSVPEKAEISATINIGAQTADILLNAYDSDSDILYYDYSFDGGKTYSCLNSWDGKDTIQFSINLTEEESMQFCCRVYNAYDRFTVSNTITIPPGAVKQEESTKESYILENTPIKQKQDDTLFTILCCLILIVILYNGFLVIYLIRKKRRKQK